MLGKNWRQRTAKRLLPLLMAVVLVFSLMSCGDRTSTGKAPGSSEFGSGQNIGKISEVSPPLVIQQLRQPLENYRPQVVILSPQPNEVLQDDVVTVQFQVQDLPIFKNPELGLGPHLHVFLDNQPYQAVYDPNQPLVLKDLTPGTHTIRVFASRPWHESFKNEGAYAQTTFHIFTKTDDNNPDPSLPLLTYSRPQASYGAEPIMLDFYLNNAPPHQIAPENAQEEIANWQIRCTVNGESFLLDRWEPIYLKGFKEGKNWVKLELIDKQGNPYNNEYNSTVRVITYSPNGQDTLSRLVRGELSVADARGIVDPDYVAKVAEPKQEPVTVPPTEESAAPETPTPEAPEAVAPAAPVVEATPTPEAPEAVIPAAPVVEATPTPEAPEAVVPAAPIVEATPEPAPAEVEVPKPTEALPEELKKPEKPKIGGFFNRFRRSSAPAQVIETPAPSPETLPKPEATPVTVPPAVPVVETPAPELPQPEPTTPEVEATAPVETPTAAPEATGFFPLPPKADNLEVKPEVVPETPLQTETSAEPPAETIPVPEVKPAELPETSEKERYRQVLEKYLKRDRQPAATEIKPESSLLPTLPEIVNTPAPEPVEKAEVEQLSDRNSSAQKEEISVPQAPEIPEPATVE